MIINNSYSNKKQEEAKKNQDEDEKQIQDVIQRRKLSKKSLDIDNFSSQLIDQQQQKQQSQTLTNIQNQQQIKNNGSSSKNSQLNFPQSCKNSRNELSPNQFEFFNSKSISNVFQNNQNKSPQYFESQTLIQKNHTTRFKRNYSQQLIDIDIFNSDFKDNKALTTRNILLKQPSDEKNMYDSKNKFGESDSIISRNQSPNQYQKYSRYSSYKSLHISKLIQENSILSNQFNKSNQTLYELYLKDFENMNKKTEQVDTENN